jgi:hypothetical protein
MGKTLQPACELALRIAMHADQNAIGLVQKACAGILERLPAKAFNVPRLQLP